MMRWILLVGLVALGACGRGGPEPASEPRAGILGAVRLPFSRGGGGRLCGVPGIEGERIAPVAGPGICGIAAPVRVTAVSGVALSRPTRMDCDTAAALHAWVAGGVRPVLPQVTGLRVAAGYVCRRRNHRPGARISEHGKGRAIDISAFRMADGTEITVLDGWRDGRSQPLLERMQASACGPFGTVLGPRSDALHQDHFHLDTAQHRSGPYCR